MIKHMGGVGGLGLGSGLDYYCCTRVVVII